MLEFTTIPDLRSWVRDQRHAERPIGFVPTMGYLHEGHLALVDEARRRSDAVVLSIFVNPLQFGPGEDFSRYPRDLERDRALAEGRGVDALFTPDTSDMYPPNSEVRVIPGAAADRWEGASRPGHFTGVLTIVTKLFHLVQPDVACFGRKDVQQATLIRRMIEDLNWPIELVICPTVREPDGLALSSRNLYLTPEQRLDARGLSAALLAAHQLWRSGVTSAARLEAAMRRAVELHPNVQVEYICVVEAEKLEPVEVVDATTILALAARVGSTRLIDNIVLGEGLT